MPHGKLFSFMRQGNDVSPDFVLGQQIFFIVCNN